MRLFSQIYSRVFDDENNSQETTALNSFASHGLFVLEAGLFVSYYAFNVETLYRDPVANAAAIMSLLSCYLNIQRLCEMDEGQYINHRAYQPAFIPPEDSCRKAPRAG